MPPREFKPGDPELSDSERLIVIEHMLYMALMTQKEQENKISRLEKAMIALSVLAVVSFGSSGIGFLTTVAGGAP